MEFKQNPFSIYDFLGYLIPGAIFVYAGLTLLAVADPLLTPSTPISEYLNFSRAELYIPVILFAYVVGHCLSFASSVTVERYSIWQFGYPSKSLFAFPVPDYDDVEDPKITRKVVRFLVGLFLLPVTAFDLLVGRRLHVRELYVRALDPLLVTVITNKLVDLLIDHGGLGKDPIDVRKHDFFRYAYHYALEHAPAHRPKMQNYVALYGFLRTLTLVAVLYFWTSVMAGATLVIHWRHSLVLVALLSALAVISFMAFMKFYRRFTLEAFMALVVSYPAPTKQPGV